MALVTQVRGGRRRARIKLRKSITKLSTDEISRLRNAISEAIARRDDRGYQFFAGWHGVPLGLCWHANALFLPWHRAYLHYFELALQDIDPDVTIPWWDWATSSEIPPPYAQERVDGRPNPLASAPINPMTSRREEDWPERTFREPGRVRPVLAPPWRDRWDWAQAAPSFSEFDRRISLLHNNVHVWVGGTMGQADWAAYDPIFWSHHAMVDRAWRIWQFNHPGGRPPDELLDTPLEPRGMTVRETLRVKQLGYDYSGTESTVGGTT